MTTERRRGPEKDAKMDAGMMSLPTLLAERYEVVRRVGTGGMGDVYLARDTLLGRQVALKILHAQYARDQSSVERFRREARAAANLQHPAIVSIYDWGQDGHLHFIVMEFVEGRSLKDLIAAEAPLAPKTACAIASQVLSALDYAHRSGLVHRDVKPGNILINSAGDARVTDFGIARTSTTDTMTQTGTILGTAYYLSPEQAQGLPVDARSDIYSLGIVLYEMVTGARPFEGDSPVAIAFKHVREQPRPPTAVRPALPATVEGIVLKAMAKRADDRYQSSSAMRADLQAFAEGRQVTTVLPEAERADDTQVMTAVGGPARRPPTTRPGWLLALALALLVGGVALGSWSLVTLLRPVVGGTNVPEIVGLDPQQAERLLRMQGLTPSFQGNEPHDSIEEGFVTRQVPDPERRIAQGSVVRFWVSSGLEFVTVPDLREQPLSRAQRMLEQEGLEVGERSDVFDDAPPNTVIGQNPRAGTQVRKTTPIDLTVSRGPETVAVPEVIGHTEADAMDILARSDLRPVREYGYSDVYDEGRVFQQDPGPGEQLRRGSTVTIYVSQGVETFSMPQVTGETESAARARLQSLQLVVETESVAMPAPWRGRVVDQDPEPGSSVRRGDRVVLQVGA